MDNKKQRIITITKGDPMRRGVAKEKGGFHFATILPPGITCGIALWPLQTVKKANFHIEIIDAVIIPFLPLCKVGNLYTGFVHGISLHNYAYCFFVDENLIADTYGFDFIGACTYRNKKDSQLQTIWLAKEAKKNFDWNDSKRPKIPYYNTIMYGLHVKGFTKHPSSKVSYRGTFMGLIEKLEYLKNLGITTIELAPAYEFDEQETADVRTHYMYTEELPANAEKITKTNYWGYKEGLYFAVKRKYCATQKPIEEFKQLIKTAHEYGIEIIMQFYFPVPYNSGMILEVLHYWTIEYMIDGFRILGENIATSMLIQDSILAEVKLILDTIPSDISFINNTLTNFNVANIDNDYYVNMRKFLKGDDDQVNHFIMHEINNPKGYATINRVSDFGGFTLADLVSYDRKHNEENGENNKDGTILNYSWNCGEEGNTQKKKIRRLRMKQMKNALCMVLLSQGTPYIRGGDEFAFSQKGNNNPYCQDNETSWLDWKNLKKNEELFAFCKSLITLRKEHPILHAKSQLKVLDYLGCGYPDVSFHGENAWNPILDNVSRNVGILFCGKYAKKDVKNEDDYFYIAYNMHWKEQPFGLPNLPDKMCWTIQIDTQSEKETTSMVMTMDSPEKKGNLTVFVPSRCVQVFQSKKTME